jgi:hypothetical protein
MVQSTVWRDLAELFRSVADVPQYHPLFAYWASHPQIVDDESVGAPFDTVDLALLDFSAGTWHCVGADVFIEYAKRAGIAVGENLTGRDPADHWLDHLARHSGCVKHDGSSGFDSPPDKPATFSAITLTIPDVCGVSARRCITLETEAFTAERATSLLVVRRAPKNGIGPHLKALYEKSGLSEKEMVERSGTDKRSLARIYRGERMPRRGKLNQIAIAVGLSSADDL